MSVEKLTAEEAFNRVPDLCRRDRYQDYLSGGQVQIDTWFAWLCGRIGAEVHCELGPQLAKAKQERDEAQRELKKLRTELTQSSEECGRLTAQIALHQHAGRCDKLGRDQLKKERDNLAARVKELEDTNKKAVNSLCEEATGRLDAEKEVARLKAELEASSAKPAPKPRRTGGQKVREALEYHAGHSDHNISDEAFEKVACEWAIPDDPDPPSDGELMRKASEASDGSTSAYWSQCAAEFLRLLAERDGGEA